MQTVSLSGSTQVPFLLRRRAPCNSVNTSLPCYTVIGLLLLEWKIDFHVFLWRALCRYVTLRTTGQGEVAMSNQRNDVAGNDACLQSCYSRPHTCKSQWQGLYACDCVAATSVNLLHLQDLPGSVGDVPMRIIVIQNSRLLWKYSIFLGLLKYNSDNRLSPCDPNTTIWDILSCEVILLAINL